MITAEEARASSFGWAKIEHLHTLKELEKLIEDTCKIGDTKIHYQYGNIDVDSLKTVLEALGYSTASDSFTLWIDWSGDGIS